VFFERERLPDAAEWQVAIDRSGFPLRLDAELDLSTQEGVIPAEFGAESTGFEYYLDTDAELPEGTPFDALAPLLRACVVLVSRSAVEARAAAAAAATLARLTSGVLYDDMDARAYGPDDAITWARGVLSDSHR
jgi:hypothetical protein